MGVTARALVLTRRPESGHDLECFEVRTIPLPELRPGEILVRSTELSVDPSMILRLRMDTYAPAFELGQPVEGRAVGEVIDSRSPHIATGTWVVHFGGWQDVAIVDASDVVVASPARGLPPHAWLHVLGAPGLTAYVGLMEVARMREGDRVWVSAASGAVGSVAAQLAKARGASVVIGSTGGREKAARLVEQKGLDAGLDHRAGGLAQQVRAVSPSGVDVYFDNVGGDHLEAALDVLTVGGRIAACGMISRYSGEESPAPRNLSRLVSSRIRMQGFLVLDHLHRREEFEDEMRDLVLGGQVVVDVEWFAGLESIPRAVASLLSGEKSGKALVSVQSEEP